MTMDIFSYHDPWRHLGASECEGAKLRAGAKAAAAASSIQSRRRPIFVNPARPPPLSPSSFVSPFVRSAFSSP